MIYLDHHATTPCDARVAAAMMSWLTDDFGNPHSDSHEAGRFAAAAVGTAIESIARGIHAPGESVVITSGATESNLLAIRGVVTHPRQKRRKIVTVATEHPAVLDVTEELRNDGFAVTVVGVDPHGRVDLDALEASIDDQTAIVSVMWANNEVGTIAPMTEIARLTHDRGALLHSDATQAVGRIPVDVRQTDVDLISGSAHKFYGPKGVGFLSVGNGNRRVRIKPIMTGGGQQRGRRGGTMNPAGIVAMAKALELCRCEAGQSSEIARHRDLLWQRLSSAIDGMVLNGPSLDSPHRLPGNLNVSLPGVEGEAWMAATPDVAFSSGSACSSVDPTPSHVLLAMGLSESEARRSVRFGIGRTTTEDEILQAADRLITASRRLSR